MAKNNENKKENKIEEPVVTKNIRYDRGKKKVFAVITKEGPIHRAANETVGIARETHHEEYDLEGIRKVWMDMNANIASGEGMVKQLKQRVEMAKELEKKYPKKEMDDLKGKLMALKQFDEGEQAKQQLEFTQNNLKELKKDRLKFEPVMKQLPKK